MLSLLIADTVARYAGSALRVLGGGKWRAERSGGSTSGPASEQRLLIAGGGIETVNDGGIDGSTQKRW